MVWRDLGLLANTLPTRPEKPQHVHPHPQIQQAIVHQNIDEDFQKEKVFYLLDDLTIFLNQKYHFQNSSFCYSWKNWFDRFLYQNSSSVFFRSKLSNIVNNNNNERIDMTSACLGSEPRGKRQYSRKKKIKNILPP